LSSTALSANSRDVLSLDDRGRTSSSLLENADYCRTDDPKPVGDISRAIQAEPMLLELDDDGP